MKLLRYGPSGREKPGLLDANGQIRDLSSLVPDISGDTISPAGLKRLSEIDPATLPVVEGNPRSLRLRSPEDPVHRPQLFGPCRRDRRGAAGGADRLRQGAERLVRTQ